MDVEEDEDVSLDEEEEEEEKPKRRRAPAKRTPASKKKKADEDFNPEEEEEDQSDGEEDDEESEGISEDEGAKKLAPAKRPPKKKPAEPKKKPGQPSEPKKKAPKPDEPEGPRARLNRLKEGFMPFEIPKGTKLTAHIIDVYDGDTITGTFGLWGQKFWCSFRLTGLDTAEKKVSNQIKTDLNNDEALITKYSAIAAEAKAYVKEKCYMKKVPVVCHGADKYGRTLCDVMIDDTTIQQQIIDMKLAFPYGGDTKNTPMDFVTQLGPNL